MGGEYCVASVSFSTSKGGELHELIEFLPSLPHEKIRLD